MILLLIIIILLAVAIRSNATDAKRRQVDYNSESYRQGYWDGVRAAEQGIASSKEAAAAAGYVEQAAAEDSKNPKQDHEVDHSDTNDEEDEPQTNQNASIAPVVNSAKESSRITINVALYVAALLLVSGIILLAQTMAFAPWLRVSLVWLMIFATYSAGLVINARWPIVKQAGLALTGTALASVPIAGITMFALTGLSPATCWLLSSLAGFVLYVHATIRLNSQLLAYISILSLFVVSMSLPGVAGLQLMWYFVVMIVFGSIMTALAHFKVSNIPEVFAKPIEQTSPIAVPAALVGALSSALVLTVLDYTVIFTSAMLYYAVQAMTTTMESIRFYTNLMARILTIIVTGLLAAYFSDSSAVAISYAIFAAGIINIVTAIFYLKPRTRSASTHEIILWVGFAISGIVAPFLRESGAVISPPLQIAELGVLAAVSLLAGIRLKRYELFWPAGVVSLFLPFAVGGRLLSPPLDFRWYIIIFNFFVSIMMTLRIGFVKKLDRISGALVYVLISLWLVISGSFSAIAGGWWPIIFWIVGSLTAYFVAVVEDGWDYAVAGGHGLLLVAAGLVLDYLQLSTSYLVIILSMVELAVTVVASEISRYFGDAAKEQASQLSAVGYSILIGFLAILWSADHQATAISWLAVVLAVGYALYRMRREPLNYLLQVVIVVEILLIGKMLELGGSVLMTFTAWLGLIGFGAVSWAFRQNQIRTKLTESWWQAGVIVASSFGFIDILTQDPSESGWRVVSWLAAVVASYLLAYLRKQARVLYLANAFAVLLLIFGGIWLELTFESISAAVAWAGLTGFYGAGWAWRIYSGVKGEAWRAMLISAVVTTLVFGLAGVSSLSIAIVVASTTAVLGATVVMAIEEYQANRPRYIDIGAVFTMIGLQRLIYLALPETDPLVYTHLWAALAFGLVLIYHLSSRPESGKKVGKTVRIVIGLLFVTWPGLTMALSEGGGYQWLFLLEHVLIVLAGVVKSHRLSTIWGAISVTLAILYMLRDYQALLNIIIGLLVIAAVAYVIWRSNRKENKKSD